MTINELTEFLNWLVQYIVNIFFPAAISNELEDGKYVLLKKDEEEEFPDRRLKRGKRPSKKSKRNSVVGC